ncbi:hypothetical protein GCM10010341_23580 [Streptomyces noursei]|nr:hypothetical protein GCM10010341_23580 [Streptomyces noursei]
MWCPSSGARGHGYGLRDRNLRSRKYGSDAAPSKAVTGPAPVLPGRVPTLRTV